MPNENNNDNNDLSDLSIDEINKLYSDIIEFPEDVRLSANKFNNPNYTSTTGSACNGGK